MLKLAAMECYGAKITEFDMNAPQATMGENGREIMIAHRSGNPREDRRKFNALRDGNTEAVILMDDMDLNDVIADVDQVLLLAPTFNRFSFKNNAYLPIERNGKLGDFNGFMRGALLEKFGDSAHGDIITMRFDALKEDVCMSLERVSSSLDLTERLKFFLLYNGGIKGWHTHPNDRYPELTYSRSIGRCGTAVTASQRGPVSEGFRSAGQSLSGMQHTTLHAMPQDQVGWVYVIEGARKKAPLFSLF